MEDTASRVSTYDAASTERAGDAAGAATASIIDVISNAHFLLNIGTSISKAADCCFIHSFLIKSGQIVTFEHIVGVGDITARRRISICLDLFQIAVGTGLADQVVVPGPVAEQEFKISLYPFFHVVIDTECGGDRRVLSDGVLLTGQKIDAFAVPEGTALEAKEIVVFFAKARFAGGTLQNGLGNDGTANFHAVFGCVFLDQRRDAGNKLVGVVIIVGAGDQDALRIEVVDNAVNGSLSCRHNAVLVQVIPLAAQLQPSGLCLAALKVVPLSGNPSPSLRDGPVFDEIVFGAVDGLETGLLITLGTKVVNMAAGLVPAGLHNAVVREEIALIVDRPPSCHGDAVFVQVIGVTACLVPAGLSDPVLIEEVGLAVQDELSGLHKAVVLEVVPVAVIFAPALEQCAVRIDEAVSLFRFHEFGSLILSAQYREDIERSINFLDASGADARFGVKIVLIPSMVCQLVSAFPLQASLRKLHHLA